VGASPVRAAYFVVGFSGDFNCVPLDLGTGGNSAPVPELYERLLALYGLQTGLQWVPHIYDD
jgi:hypothetical protein